MPNISNSDLITALKDLLDDQVVGIVDAHSNWQVFLDSAAAQLGGVIRYIKMATLTLTAHDAEYVAPDDLIAYSYTHWGQSQSIAAQNNPWDYPDPEPLPIITIFDDAGTRSLLFSPAPSGRQIAALGTQFRYFYRARHVLNSSESSIPEDQISFFLTLAQIEVMLFIAKRNSGKPVQLRDGYSGTPSNGTPAALAQQLRHHLDKQLADYRRAA